MKHLFPAAVIAVLAASAMHGALAQSPLEFLQQQQRRQERQRVQPTPPPPAQTAPAQTSPAPAAEQATPRANESSVPTAPAAAARPTAPQNLPPPPYEKDIRRIGEILGALHYLRPLCGADDGAIWRDKMRDLIESEGAAVDRRERLAGAFNEGYNAFQTTYRTCTPSADLAVRRYLEEGSKLTREIATRHGG